MKKQGPPPTAIKEFNDTWRSWINLFWKVEPWSEVASFSNSWANVGGSYYNASYQQDSSGLVLLRGRIDSGTSGTAAFTLPEGYRPSKTMDFITDGNAGGAPVIVSVVITSAGVVTPTLTGANPEVSFDGIIFRAEA